jgi:hypothetical protein
VRAVENPSWGVTTLDVPAIREAGAAPMYVTS